VADMGWEIVPQAPPGLGSWKKSGYPFYSDRVSYVKTVPIDRIPERMMVQLGEWSGTVAEVLVNNRLAAIIQSPPYQADITHLVEKGLNSIEVTVFGSLKNLLGPHHNVTRRGIVTPWSFKYAPAVQPAGGDYDLLDYGLMEEFSIMVSDR
jgi:hypothetical protein